MTTETDLQVAARAHAEARLALIMARRGVSRAQDELNDAKSAEGQAERELRSAEQALDRAALADARPTPFQPGDVVLSEAGVRMVFLEQDGAHCLCEWRDSAADDFRKQWLPALSLRRSPFEPAAAPTQGTRAS